MKTTTAARATQTTKCWSKAWQGSNWIRRSTRLAIYSRDGFCCVYCKRGAEDGVLLTLDHVTAKALGGTNAVTNLVTACLDCNVAKGEERISAFATGRVLARVFDALARPIDRAEGRRLAALRAAKKSS